MRPSGWVGHQERNLISYISWMQKSRKGTQTKKTEEGGIEIWGERFEDCAATGDVGPKKHYGGTKGFSQRARFSKARGEINLYGCDDQVLSKHGSLTVEF